MAVSLNDVSSIYDVTNYFAADDKTVIQRLQGDRLIKQCGRCRFRRCRRQTVLYRNTDYKGNYAKYCKTCRKFESLTSGTLFEETHLGFRDIVMLAFLWSEDICVTNSAGLIDLPKSTIVHYQSYFREIASWKLINDQNNFNFGGPGVEVQIDESFIRGQWVLGIYDTNLRRGIVRLVEARGSAQLLPVIQEHVLPGSVIMTDSWKAYNQLNQLGYNHYTVNHSENFRDPVTGACTNAIEAYWSRLKGYLRQMNSMGSRLTSEHIDAFMWHDTYCPKPIRAFPVFLQHIRERYPV